MTAQRTATLHSINPLTKRRRRNVKAAIKDLIIAIEELGGEVEGFSILVWDARGLTRGGHMAGGAIAKDAIPAHVFSVSTNLLVDHVPISAEKI